MAANLHGSGMGKTAVISMILWAGVRRFVNPFSFLLGLGDFENETGLDSLGSLDVARGWWKSSFCGYKYCVQLMIFCKY